MDARDGDPGLLAALEQPVRAMLRAREHDHVARSSPRLSSSRSSAGFSSCDTGYTACVMPDRRRRRPLEVDRRRVLAASPASASTIGAGIVAEKNSVCRFGREMLEHAADVGEKSHVEHPVRLVQHEHLEPVELRVADAGSDRAAGPASR